MSKVATLSVDLGERRYDILIGRSLITRAGQEIAARFKSRQVRIVSDKTVAAHYLVPLCDALTKAGFAFSEPVIVPAGEHSKSMAQLETVCETLLASRLERSTLIVALGGGVVGDLAGFAASILLRGLDFVQIPTTLLAQVDSSVGGKTGINAKAGKNLIGSFHQPGLVIADTDTLQTLSERELRSGYAEIVKYGLIVDPAFFAWLEQNGLAVSARDPAALAYAIHRSCEIKADIVARDELEQGDRALLNFGHTFGHAMEVLIGYDDRLTHGEAVAIGMVMALDLSVRQGLCPASERDRTIAHYKTMGLRTRPEPIWGLSPQAVLQAMQKDKKNSNGRLRLVLSHGIGKAFLTDAVEELELTACLNSFFS